MAHLDGTTKPGFGGLVAGSETERLALELFVTTYGMDVEQAVTAARREMPGLRAYVAEYDAWQRTHLAAHVRAVLGVLPPGTSPASTGQVEDTPDSWIEVEQAAAAPATRQVRQRTTPPAGDAPCCDVHGTPMRPGRYGWYCPKTLSNGEYCKHRISFDDIPAPASTGA